MVLNHDNILLVAVCSKVGWVVGSVTRWPTTRVWQRITRRRASYLFRNVARFAAIFLLGDGILKNIHLFSEETE